MSGFAAVVRWGGHSLYGVLAEFARGPAGRTHPATPNLDRLGIVG